VAPHWPPLLEAPVFPLHQRLLIVVESDLKKGSRNVPAAFKSFGKAVLI
jgi:hypothetical protein